MPRSNPFDQIVDKITSECNTSEDWGLIMEVCDKVKTISNGPKDCLHSISRRLNHSDPHVVLLALTLLDACIKNSGRNFHLEVCSRSFVDGLKKMLLSKKCHPKTMDKLKMLIRRWAEEDFKKDPQLSLMPALYNSLKKEAINFNVVDDENKSAAVTARNASTLRNRREEDDITKAIKLSLKENNSSPKSSKSLYPTAASPLIHQNSPAKEPRKVRALYDFEAAEDNELTFKSGEIILVLDDSDSNWWKGSNHRGEGLFPANFVTADLTAETEFPSKEMKEISTESISLNKEIKSMESNETVAVDEEIIDRVLRMLHEADPTSEQPECDDLLSLNEYCMAMGPLIDQELQKIDRRHASLTSASQQLMDALNCYHSLMKDCVPMVCNPCPVPTATFPYPQQPYCNAPYLPPESFQQLPMPNIMQHQQFVHNEPMMVGSTIPQSQNQYPIARSGPFMNMHPHPVTNPVVNNVHSNIPHTTATSY